SAGGAGGTGAGRRGGRGAAVAAAGHPAPAVANGNPGAAGGLHAAVAGHADPVRLAVLRGAAVVLRATLVEPGPRAGADARDGQGADPGGAGVCRNHGGVAQRHAFQPRPAALAGVPARMAAWINALKSWSRVRWKRSGRDSRAVHEGGLTMSASHTGARRMTEGRQLEGTTGLERDSRNTASLRAQVGSASIRMRVEV